MRVRLLDGPLRLLENGCFGLGGRHAEEVDGSGLG